MGERGNESYVGLAIKISPKCTMNGIGHHLWKQTKVGK